MKSHYLQLFNALLDELDQCAQTGLHERKRFEQCFWISRKYNKELIQLLEEYPFLNEMDEIDFFRNVKPKFTCFTEFFTITSESLMCVPDSPQRAIAFWNDELKRYVRFRRRHSSFISYYENGKFNFDRDYFLRSTCQKVGTLNAMIFDGNPEYHSSGDWLVRSLLAHKMYSRYAEDKVRESFGNLRSEVYETEFAIAGGGVLQRPRAGDASFSRSLFNCAYRKEI